MSARTEGRVIGVHSTTVSHRQAVSERPTKAPTGALPNPDHTVRTLGPLRATIEDGTLEWELEVLVIGLTSLTL